MGESGVARAGHRILDGICSSSVAVESAQLTQDFLFLRRHWLGWRGVELAALLARAVERRSPLPPSQHNVGKHKKQEDERLLQACHDDGRAGAHHQQENRNVLRLRRSSLKSENAPRDTMRAESTSTMSAVEPSLTSWYEPALWLTMTMKTSTLAGGRNGQAQHELARLDLAGGMVSPGKDIEAG